MKIKILSLILTACLSVGAAETNKPSFLRGNMDIKFHSRVTSGAKDVYTLNLNMSDSAVFRGSITNTPIIVGSFDRVTRPASLNYQIECDVVNPNNPSQTKNVGKLYGMVPISAGGVYNYSSGTLKVSVYPMGRAQGFDSKYSGTAAGKPLHKSTSVLDTLRKEALNIQKQVKGQTVALVVTNYDRMIFTSHKMAAGPVQIYPEAVVNGKMIYDYERTAWYFHDVSIVYGFDGSQKLDKLSGSIRWIEQAKKGGTRDGEYQFDVRVNEPAPSETSVFAGATSETAFFETDDTIAALTGTMKYRDTFTGEKVSASAVTIDLNGHKLSRQQCMNLAKLIMFTAVVPMNGE